MITRGEGSFTLQDVPVSITVGELKTLVCEKFNELYPDGLEPEIDWNSME